MGSKLSGEVIQGVKTVAGIEAFLVLTVAALHLAVVARRIRPDELVAGTPLGGGGLKQRRGGPPAIGKSGGKIKTGVGLGKFHAGYPAGKPP